jgi:hypothetical protein
LHDQRCFPIRDSKPSVPEKIQDIAKHTRFGLVEFGVFTAGAGDSGEFFVLNVEKLRQPAAGCCELTRFELPVFAFGALPVTMLHFILLYL